MTAGPRPEECQTRPSFAPPPRAAPWPLVRPRSGFRVLMEKKMEGTIKGLGFRVQGLRLKVMDEG